MKAQTFDLSSLIALGNQIFALFPKLMSLAYFGALVFLTVRAFKSWRSAQGLSIIELSAIAVAFALAGGR